MTQLSTIFLLRVLAAAQLCIAGGFRVRGDLEQVYIFSRGFGYPSWLRVIIGISQLASAVLLVIRPTFGVSPAVALCTFMMLSHAFRQRLPLSGILDLFVLVVVSIVGLYTNSWSGVPTSIGVGIAAYLALSAAFPKRDAVKKT